MRKAFRRWKQRYLPLKEAITRNKEVLVSCPWQSSLTRLPCEIRIRIYEELFSELELYWKGDTVSAVARVDDAENPRSAPYSIFLTCRLCYREAHEIYWKFVSLVWSTAHDFEVPLDAANHAQAIVLHVSKSHGLEKLSAFFRVREVDLLFQPPYEQNIVLPYDEKEIKLVEDAEILSMLKGGGIANDLPWTEITRVRQERPEIRLMINTFVLMYPHSTVWIMPVKIDLTQQVITDACDVTKIDEKYVKSYEQAKRPEPQETVVGPEQPADELSAAGVSEGAV